MGAPPPFDRARLVEAFERLGADLAARGAFVELAVYGGSALTLQFAWRRGTEAVDAVARPGSDARVLLAAAARVAEGMGLPADWLNDAVGLFTPLVEDEALFLAAGTYPAAGTPGLRVLLARPRYRLAMKLLALRSADRGDRDLLDARALAAELGITGADALCALHASVHGEAPSADLAAQFSAVLAPGGPVAP